MENIMATTARVIATGCPSCMIQLADGIIRNGLNLQVWHTLEVLAWCMGRASGKQAARPGIKEQKKESGSH